MTLEIALILGLLAALILVFATEWLSVDLGTLILLVLLILTGILTPAEAFAGFANEIIIILASVFVISGALLKTGVMEELGFLIERITGGKVQRVVAFVMGMTAAVSTMMNNTTTTAVFLPAVLGVCRRRRISPSRVLMPMAFASMLGGTCVLVGTSTNVAASGFIHRLGLPAFSLFEFLPVGLTMAGVGIAFTALFGYRLLPNIVEPSFTEDYEIKQYLSEIVVPQGSMLAGVSLRQSPLSDLGITVLEIVRPNGKLYPDPGTTLNQGDVLLVNASRQSLMQIKETAGLEIKADIRLGDKDLITDTIKVVEAIIMPQSVLVGRTIKEVNFRSRFGVTAVAIYRKGHGVAEKLGTMPLRVGDVLLLQGRRGQFDPLAGNPDLWILEETYHLPFRRRRGYYAIGALVLALGAGGSGLVPIPIAFLSAALIVVLLKCITTEEAYNFIDWRLLILIAGMVAYGDAMEKTHTAEFLAAHLVKWTAPLGIHFIMGGFIAMTILLTQTMPNASAALVTLPIALSTADQLGVNPITFAVLITLSASMSFVTPFEPSCLIVYGPGKYRFRDFVVAGLPLTIIAFAVLLVLVPTLWPL